MQNKRTHSKSSRNGEGILERLEPGESLPISPWTSAFCNDHGMKCEGTIFRRCLLPSGCAGSATSTNTAAAGS